MAAFAEEEEEESIDQKQELWLSILYKDQDRSNDNSDTA
jgi:hypothetical protein